MPLRRILLIGLLFSGCAILKETTRDDSAAPTGSGRVEEAPPGRKLVVVAPFGNRSSIAGPLPAEAAAAEARNAVLRCSDCALANEDSVPLPQPGDPALSTEKALLDWARTHGVHGLVMGWVDDVRLIESESEGGLFGSERLRLGAAVQIQLFDVESGKLLYTEGGYAESEESFSRIFGDEAGDGLSPERAKTVVGKASQKAAADLSTQLKRIDWTGRIAKADGHRYYINAGERSGIAVGQLLKVYGEGVPVTDPQNGAFLGTAPGRIKGLLKVIEHFGSDGSVAVLHSGAGVREQDRVQTFHPSEP